MPNLPQDKLWTTNELAEAAGCNDSTIRYRLIGGRIKGIKMAGRWFIPNDEALRFVEEWKDAKEKE